jgi:hypothetical protein
LGAGHGSGGAYNVHNLLGQDPPDLNKEEPKKKILGMAALEATAGSRLRK